MKNLELGITHLIMTIGNLVKENQELLCKNQELENSNSNLSSYWMKERDLATKLSKELEEFKTLKTNENE